MMPRRQWREGGDDGCSDRVCRMNIWEEMGHTKWKVDWSGEGMQKPIGGGVKKRLAGVGTAPRVQTVIAMASRRTMAAGRQGWDLMHLVTQTVATMAF